MPWITPRPPSVPARTSGFPEPAGPRRPSRTPRPTRRSVLVTAVGAGGAALLTGCSDAGDASGAIAEASLERRMREGAVRDSEELLERYDRTIAAHPDLAGRLTPLRASVAAHPAALAFVEPGRSGERQASPSASATATPAPSGEPVPPKAADALAELADAERSLAETRTVALAGAPGELARLLASVAACGAVHAYLLTSTPGA